MTTISVTGAAQRLLPPERGTARVLVRFEGARRDEVAAAATALHARLTADARRFVRQEAATDWTADQVWVSVADRFQGEHRERKRVTVASGAVRVTFVDFPVLSRWLAELAEEEGAEVFGIEWTVPDDRLRAVEAEVRTEAVLDALERARAYATALGLGGVEPARIFEPGLRSDDGRGWGPAGRAGAMMAMSASGPEFTVRPEEIEVSAEVTADFTAG